MRREDFVNADFLLIRKIKQGDEDAFDALIRKYYKEILNYCRYHCPDQEYAEDFTQETFVRFFKNISSYCFQGKTKNYLYTIAGNLCRDYYKKKREIPMEETAFEQALEPEAGQMDHAVDKLTVEWAIQQLPEELKEVVILYYFQELKLAEIAKVTQTGLPLVKYRIRQAKKQLALLLDKDG